MSFWNMTDLRSLPNWSNAKSFTHLRPNADRTLVILSKRNVVSLLLGQGLFYYVSESTFIYN